MAPRTGPDDASPAGPTTGDDTDLLAELAGHQAEAWRAEVEMLTTTLAWAEANGEGAVIADPYGPLGEPVEVEGTDQAVDLAGPGAPLVSDLATCELAASLRMTADAGRRWVGDCLEIGHRLPRLHARLLAGDLPVWRARRIARETIPLPVDGARWVDAQLAGTAHRVGPVVLDRLVAEALWRFDPEEAETRAAEASEARKVTIHRPGPAEAATGLAHVDAALDVADALDLDAALSAVAADLAAADEADQGWTDPFDVRRARALGVLARRQLGDPERRTGRRDVTLYVHTTAEQLAEPERPGLARLDNTRGFVTVEQVRAWISSRDADHVTVTVKPVVDLRETVGVEQHEVPDRLAERVRLARPTCAFPWCARSARRADVDHVDEGGPTSDPNLAPLCRHHHRAKTHPSPSRRRWRYLRDPLDPGTFHWTSPTGHRYTVDPTGTVSPPTLAA